MITTIRIWNGKPRANSKKVLHGAKNDIIWWDGVKIEFSGLSTGNYEYPQEVLDDLKSGRRFTRIRDLPGGWKSPQLSNPGGVW
jgi:hypothetical protein